MSDWPTEPTGKCYHCGVSVGRQIIFCSSQCSGEFRRKLDAGSQHQAPESTVKERIIRYPPGTVCDTDERGVRLGVIEERLDQAQGDIRKASVQREIDAESIRELGRRVEALEKRAQWPENRERLNAAIDECALVEIAGQSLQTFLGMGMQPERAAQMAYTAARALLQTIERAEA